MRLQPSEQKTLPRYRMLAGITVGSVIFLILVGSVVRMTGSGMGCPDWPQCFGQWVPPTELSQLPADYKQRFAVGDREIADFDAFKTWVEYVNRLLGVLIGFFALLTAAFSIPLRKTRPVVFRLSVAGLLLVIIQGGIGAYVVRTHLHTGMITLHMVVALLVLALFLGAWLRSYRERWEEQAVRQGKLPAFALPLAGSLLVLILIQIVMGTQVREQVDEVALALGESLRLQWIDQLTGVYHVHKFFHYAILLVFGAMWYRLRGLARRWSWLGRMLRATAAFLLLEIALGIGMHRLGILAAFQPAHLLGATLIFSLVFALLMVLYWMGRSQQRMLGAAGAEAPAFVSEREAMV